MGWVCRIQLRTKYWSSFLLKQYNTCFKPSIYLPIIEFEEESVNMNDQISQRSVVHILQRVLSSGVRISLIKAILKQLPTRRGCCYPVSFIVSCISRHSHQSTHASHHHHTTTYNITRLICLHFLIRHFMFISFSLTLWCS